MYESFYEVFCEICDCCLCTNCLSLDSSGSTFVYGKFNDLKTMLESDDIDGMRAMMRHSTERRALFDKKQKSDLFEYFMKGVELFIKSWYNK